MTECPPLTCSYRGYVLASAPPPCSGGATLCEILNILEGYDLKALGFHSAQACISWSRRCATPISIATPISAIPAFVKNPLDRLLSKEYAAAIRARIDPVKATPSSEVEPGIEPHEKPETTHYSVVDKDGNAVSVTFTINGFFGANVIAPGTGFFLNDEMDDFTVKPGVPNLFGLVQGDGQCDRARQAAALLDGADARLQGRQCLSRPRQPRRLAHHHHRGRDHR